MANVDANKVIRKLAERIADEAISRAAAEVALEDALTENAQLKVAAASNPAAETQD